MMPRILSKLPVGFVFFVAACSQPINPSVRNIEPIPPAVTIPPDEVAVSLTQDGVLSNLAGRLDAVAFARASELQDLRTIRARRQATEFGRYPRVLPTGSVPLTGDGDANLGLAVSQMIWDGGRMTAQLNDLDHQEVRTLLALWVARNEAVYDGLSAFVSILEHQQQVAIYQDLAGTLDRLSDLLDTRLQGGVADRGEVLRLTAARNSVQRETMLVQADLRQSRTELERLLSTTANIPSGGTVQALAAQCSRAWPDVVAPEDALALSRVHRAAAAADLTEARRFPTLIAEAGVDLLTGAAGVVGLRIDAGDMLGTGRRAELEAVAAQIEGSIINFQNQMDDTKTTLSQLTQKRGNLNADIDQFQSLIQTNSDSITLYEEQLNAGSIQIADGIDLYRNEAETRVDLVGLQADLIRNCLETSRVRGVLVRFDAQNALPTGTQDTATLVAAANQ